MAAVAYREPDTAAAARRRLRPRGREVRTHRLVPHSDARQTVNELIRAVEAMGNGVLHVTGWEEAFGGPDFAARVYDFNFLRESVVENPATQVWWMPVAFRNAFMAAAPDTWSVVKLKMFLASLNEYMSLSSRVGELVRAQLGVRANSSLPRRSVEKLTHLSAFHRQLDEKELSEIFNLTQLRSLDLSFSPVKDLSGLSKLTSLQSLLLMGTDVTDISPLEALKSLRILALGMTKVENIAPLWSLESLRFLSIGDTPVADITPLTSIKSIVDLNLENTDIKDFSPLWALHLLEELNLAGTWVSDLSFVAHLKMLTRLNLRDSHVENLNPVKSVASLEWLDISGLRVPYSVVRSLRKSLPNCEILR